MQTTQRMGCADERAHKGRAAMVGLEVCKLVLRHREVDGPVDRVVGDVRGARSRFRHHQVVHLDAGGLERLSYHGGEVDGVRDAGGVHAGKVRLLEVER